MARSLTQKPPAPSRRQHNGSRHSHQQL
jgi:hypothetical protein